MKYKKKIYFFEYRDIFKKIDGVKGIKKEPFLESCL